MNILTGTNLSKLLNTNQPYISSLVKKSREKNIKYIEVRNKKYYFKKKSKGKGYEYCEVPFNEVSNSVEVSLNSNLNDIVVDKNKTLQQTQQLQQTPIIGTSIVVNELSNTFNTEKEQELENLSIEAKKKLDLKVSAVKAWKQNKKETSDIKFNFEDFRINFLATNKKDIELAKGFDFSRKNIRDWDKAYSKDGIYALMDKRGRKQGQNYKIKPWITELVEELIIYKRGGISAKNLYTIINKEAYKKGELSQEAYKNTIEKELGGAISLSRMRTLVNSLKKDKQIEYLNNPDKYKNNRLPAFGDMSAKAEYANHYWEIDSTALDAFGKSDYEFETTWNLISISDIKTRMKVIGIVKNSNSQGIAELLYKAFNKLGIPENIVTDNGKDYLSKHTIGLLERWGINHVRTAPYAGEQKPFVERHFGTLQNSFTELLNGYKGHNVAEFKAITSQTATSDRLSGNSLDKQVEFISDITFKLDEWVDNIYSNNTNRSLGTTPYKSYIEDEEKIKRADIEKLAFAFGKKIEVTVGKKGIRHNKKVYNNIDGLLGDKVGDDFIMIIDLLNHEKAYLFTLEGEWICPVGTDIVGKDTAVRAKQHYKYQQKELEKTFKQIHKKHKDRKDIDEIIEAAKEVYADQTPIMMIGGNGETNNSSNVDNLVEIANEIEKYDEKIKLSQSKPNLERREEALIKEIEQKEKEEVLKPKRSYADLILNEAV